MTNNDDDLLNFFNLYELIEIKTGEGIISAKEVFGDDISVPVRKYINGDESEVLIFPEDLKTPINRYAENDDDFEIILIREANKKNQNAEDYREIFLADLKLMLEKDIKAFQKSNTDITDKRIRVGKLIKYLQTRTTCQQAKKVKNPRKPTKQAKLFKDYFLPVVTDAFIEDVNIEFEKMVKRGQTKEIAIKISNLIKDGDLEKGIQIKPFLRLFKVHADNFDSLYSLVANSHYLLR